MRLQPARPAPAETTEPSRAAGPPRAADTATPVAEPASTRPARARVGTVPARFTFGLPGLKTGSTTGGPTRPDVSEQPRRAPAVSGRAMTAGQLAATQRQVSQAMNALHTVQHPESGLPTTPQTRSAMRSDEGFRSALQTMCGDGAGGRELANLVLGSVPPEAGGAAPYSAPLMLATALRSVGIETLEQATHVLMASTQGEHFLRTMGVDAQGNAVSLIVPTRRDAQVTPEHDQALFRLERVLATTAPGTQALGKLRHLEGRPEQLEAVRDGLSLCAALESKGFSIEGTTSVQEVLVSLQGEPATRAKMNAPIGRDDDAPLQLLAQALKHTQDLHAGVATPPGAPERAAFVAWKKGGFIESGPGTEFNQTIGRLHKFMTYVDRADHGPRTLGNMARDAGAWIGRTLGAGKSPLTPMRHGTQGGDLGLLHEEAAKFKQSLNHALGAAVENLVDELRDPVLQQNPAARNKTLAKAAVFDLWRETGLSTLPLSDVLARAGRLAAEGGPGAAGVHDAALLPHLRSFTRKARTDDGEAALKVRMPALEAMGTARSRRGAVAEVAEAPADPQLIRQEIQQLRALPTRNAAQQERLATCQRERRQLVSALVADMRSAETAGADDKPLFKFSDLKVLFRGTPRAGPNAADAQQVMKALASAKYESMSTFADGASRGAGTFGALPLSSSLALGLPLVYPVVRAEAGKRAAVTIGVSNTGGRFFVGTETSKSITLGVGGGWVAPPLVNKLVSAVVLAEATLGHGTGHGEGAVITTRNDLPGWHDKLPQVVDFMFDQARLDVGGFEGRAADASQLWSRFADRFGDDPHVAIGWNKENSAGSNAQVSAVAVARVAAGTTTAIGPAFAASLRAEGSHFQRTPHADGADVPVAVHQRRLVGSAAATLTQTAPLVPTSGGPVLGWGSAMPLVGASMEWNLAGGLGVARLGRTREGQLSPGLCHRELIFQEPKRLVEYANLNRSSWEAAMVAQDPSGGTTPEAARARFNGFLEQVAASPKSADRLHGELMTLAPQAADQINQYEARLNTMLGHGDRTAQSRPLSAPERTECDALQNEVQRLLKDDGNWLHGGIYSVELNQVGGTSGLNFGVRSVNQEQARAARLTTLLIASVPEV